jgi:hypothetical protein
MPKEFQQTLSARKLKGCYFLGEERSADGGIHATWDHKNIISVLQSSKKKKKT